MEEQIFNANDLPWIQTDEGETKILVGDKFSKSSRLRLFKLNPGQSYTTHDHDFTQCMYFFSGNGLVSIDDREEKIEPNLTVIVLPNQCHSVKNTGTEPMEILVFESHEQNPRDTPFVDF